MLLPKVPDMAQSRRSRTSKTQKVVEEFGEQVMVAVVAGAILAALGAVLRSVTTRS